MTAVEMARVLARHGWEPVGEVAFPTIIEHIAAMRQMRHDTEVRAMTDEGMTRGNALELLEEVGDA